MHHYFIFFFNVLLIIPALLKGQNFEKIFFSKVDPYKMYENDGDSTMLHYYKLMPQGQIKNVLVVLPGAYEKTEEVLKNTELPHLAQEKGFLVIIPSLNWGTLSLSIEINYLDTIFSQVVNKHEIKNCKWAIGGFSKGGMLAISYTEFAIENPGQTTIIPSCIFGVDPPLDLSQLWYNCEKDIERNFSEAAVHEARWILKDLIKELGGSPEIYRSKYLKYSPFFYHDKEGGNAKFLKNVPILLFTEPDIEWQMKNRQRDFYDLNALNISAMINMLQQSGNENAKMIVSHGKGIRSDGKVHPHSWSIMNSKESLHWISQMLVK